MMVLGGTIAEMCESLLEPFWQGDEANVQPRGRVGLVRLAVHKEVWDSARGTSSLHEDWKASSGTIQTSLQRQHLVVYSLK